MLPKNDKILNFHNVRFIIYIALFYLSQNIDFNKSLLIEFLFICDYFQCRKLFTFMIKYFQDLTITTFTHF
jgi:hypothetical protein